MKTITYEQVTGGWRWMIHVAGKLVSWYMVPDEKTARADVVRMKPYLVDVER